MDKKVVYLRNQLFEKYFENRNGISLPELMNKLEFIVDTWLRLHELLEKNSEDVNKHTRIELIEKINYNNKNYLIIKFLPWNYLILDLDNLKVLSTEEIFSIFDESFFVNNYNEKYINEGINNISLYWFYTYNGDINNLINFYIENIDIFSLTPEIFYKINIREAWTYLSIKITSGRVQLGFQTEDQMLYERLFINSDLTPYGIQDARSKIGREKMKEMFKRLKDIIIPFDIIPEDLLECIKNYDNMKLSLKKQEE